MMWQCWISLILEILVPFITCGIRTSQALSSACKPAGWRNMTMEERLFKSDVVVYGKDLDHGKFRNPTDLDSRFEVFCILKSGNNIVPGTVIIEDIRSGDECSATQEQTKEGGLYILGLTRQLTGFMKYADVNPLQKTAFPASEENFETLAAICGLDEWKSPKTGAQLLCPTPRKPLWCTKIRDPASGSGRPVGLDVSSVLVICSMTLYRVLQTSA